jgi:acyl-CoA dehydrogenase
MKLSCDDLPMFFEPAHAELAVKLRHADDALVAAEAGADEATRDRLAVRALADHGMLALVAPRGGTVDARSVCLARELCGYLSARADSILAVQGLGVHPLLLANRAADVAPFAAGDAIAAFALTEPDAGSDVAAIATTARQEDGDWIVSGDKIFISNLGIATHATVFATIDRTAGHRGITAFWVPLDTPGITVERQTAIAPHPIGRLVLRDVRLPVGALIGVAGGGFKLAMQTLDAFRVTVGAAAVGMARRALDEARAHVVARHQFGKPLAEQPLVQAHLADMAVDLDAARLLVLRAAWIKDTTRTRATREVSIAKLGATEAAQRVIDRAVQLLGGRGVMAGSIVEHLYRAIRPLRIYEGTSEIQRTIIGRSLAEETAT